MYVCLCKAVTDRQIKQAVCEGACSMRCLNRELGVATECGKCATEAKKILREQTSATFSSTALDVSLERPHTQTVVNQFQPA